MSTTSQYVTVLPGRIQAEDYDSYFDTTAGNAGGRYRADNVDIGNVFPDDGTHEVGWIVASEWLQYSVSVAQTADYVLRLRVAQFGTGAQLHAVVDGTCTSKQGRTPTVIVPTTVTYRHWITMPVATIRLTAGTHNLRLCFDQTGGGMNLNWLELVPRPLLAPGRIEAEDFDPTEGVGYHDSNNSNQGGRYRTSEGVDISDTYRDADLATNEVTSIVAGEWLRYTVQAQQAGNYVVRARIAQNAPGGVFHLEVDGVNVTGPVAVPNIGPLNMWVTVPLATVNLTSGAHAVRLVFDQNASNGTVVNLNWIEVVAESVIAAENRQTGSTAWRDSAELGGPNDITYTDSPLKGFASATSVNKGDSISFYIRNTAPSGLVQMQIFRMGHYGGTHGRLMTSTAFLPQTQRDCVSLSTGQFECNWDLTYALSVPTTWESGVYIAKITSPAPVGPYTPNGIAGNYIPFVVRDDARNADFLYIQPVTTYQAYSNYPSVNCFVDGPGRSLYTPQPAFEPRVSFKRPYCGSGAVGGAGGGSYASGPGDVSKNEVLLHELNLIAFLEAKGFDVAYATDIDLHRMTPARLASYRGIIFASHDEYWSSTMRNNVEEARDAGVHLAFLGSNIAYWQIRFEDAERTMVSYRTAVTDEVDPMPHSSLQTDLFRAVGRPEQWLIGVQYGYCCAPVDRYFPLKNLAYSSLVFAASPTPITQNTAIDLTVGHESDYYQSNVGLPAFVFDGTTQGPQPAPPRVDASAYEILASSYIWDLVAYPNCPQNPELLDPTTREQLCGPTGLQNSSLYRAPSGAHVFAAGTLGWSLNLANVGRYFQQSDIMINATQNLLYQFLADQRPTRPTNLATGSLAFARSWYETTFWAPEGWLRANIVDGRRNSTFGTSMGYTSAGSTNQFQEEWIYVVLPTARTFSKVVLYPTNDPGNVGAFFPVDFNIQVWNGSSWVTKVAVANYPQPSTGQSFVFPAETGQYLRIQSTRMRGNGFYYLQLAELELY